MTSTSCRAISSPSRSTSPNGFESPSSGPKTWRRYPAPAALQRLGNGWLDRAPSAALRVPSAVIPTESNYLLNPLHRDAAQIRVVGRKPFHFDERLVKR